VDPQAPLIETGRLALRRLTTGDAAFILELLNDPEFLRHIGDKGVRTEADACRYLETGPIASYGRHGFGLYRVGLRESGEAIGMCGLLKRDWLDDVDIGFAYLPRFRRQGYGREAAAAVLALARDAFGLSRVVAITSPGNEPSIRLLAGLGFRYERTARPSEKEPEVRVFGLEW
jgi:[ribosomal protein S5]-alanine N-acetyltransferase